MELEDTNITNFKTNVTLDQVMDFFNLNLSNVNQSEVSQIHLFDLYEAYKTIEKEQLMVYKSVAYIIGTLIILSNLTVVISSGLILRKGQQPKSTYLLLGNVSLADTIVGFSLIFGVTVDNSVSSNPLCIFQIGMLVCPAMVSIFSVGLIAVDRYIYILHGLYYQRWFNTTRVRIGILCIWMIGIFISTLPAMGWTGRTFRDFRCWYIAVFPSALLLVLSIVVLSVIIMVCILYILILRSAVKAVDKIREFKENSYTNKGFIDDLANSAAVTSNSDSCGSSVVEMRKFDSETQTYQSDASRDRRMGCCRMSSSHPSKLKAVKTVLIVTLCFLGTWAPYYVAVIMYVKCDIMKNGYECIPLEILTLGPLYLLGVCNSLCDPLIYAWRHSGFKSTLKRIYWKCLAKHKI
ncbi:melanocyte-stimulating hormone receptor isoform X2 [Spodoptera frugiperda]|uniref:Melanocyte-stimulating hormone receptor isoform X2 n=1 Tax=Spodoptera frugiperda TaxID=7108 RepID=A0A9R0EPE6_SPOFR|nr:melanocyte-stimulating hormone receptor isoform X2 [Spodoptera frugiperda]